MTDSTDSTNSTPDGDVPTPQPVGGLPEMGSAPLAAALAARDVEAIGRALRLDYVVVPLLRREDGATEIRVFGTAGATPETTAWELCLFSSTQALAIFLGDDPGSEFGLQPGSSLAPFLTEHVGFLSAVTFDPASPHAITASPADVLAILEPRPEDNDVEWATSGADNASHVPVPPVDSVAAEARVIGFDLPLAGEWLPITLRDRATYDRQVAALVGNQLARMTAAPALHAELAGWIAESSARAAAGGAKFLAYLLQGTNEGALALNVAVYLQELGIATADISHLDRVGGTLHKSLVEGEELVEADTPDGPLLRHTRTVAGEPGAATTPQVLVDFWLEFPDHRGICLVAFSGPQVAQADLLTALADNVVWSGIWVRETPVD
jgi:hypothetical protein